MKSPLILFCLVILIALTACNLPIRQPATVTPPPSTPGTITPTIPGPTSQLSTITSTTIPPTAALTFTPQPPTSTSTLPSAQRVQIFLIAIGDNGVSGKMIGCGDSVVPVDISIEPTTGVLRAALEKLLAIKTQLYGMSGFYDALYQSDLSIASLEITNGVAEMRLSGSLILGGECDAPRVQAQLEEIALQFSTVQSVAIFINDIPLEDVLSLK
jgi:hypothetical protein